MSRKITLLILVSYLSIFSYSQVQSYSCVIPKYDCEEYYIVNPQMDSTSIAQESRNSTLINGKSYKSTYGVGKQKDSRGIKEKRKKYLIEPNGDKAYFTWKNDGNIYVDDTTIIEIVPTDFGWQFIESDSIVVCEVDLLWNNLTWNYYIQYYELSYKTKAIKKYLSVNMVTMAKVKSGFESKDEQRVGLLLNLLEIFLYSYY